MSKKHQDEIGNLFLVDMEEAQVPHNKGVWLYAPWPPSVNSIWRAIRRGDHATIILSKVGREYFAKATETLKQQARLAGLKTFENHVKVFVELSPPDARKRDADNPIKPIFDVLQKANIVINDSIIKDYRVRWHAPDRPGGRVVIYVEEIE